jgi:molybdopterin converting factor small subunit
VSMGVRVEVSLAAMLRKAGGPAQIALDLADGATVADALRASGVADRVDVWVLRNGRRVERTEALSSGDVLTLFTPSGGG